MSRDEHNQLKPDVSPNWDESHAMFGREKQRYIRMNRIPDLLRKWLFIKARNKNAAQIPFFQNSLLKVLHELHYRTCNQVGVIDFIFHCKLAFLPCLLQAADHRQLGMVMVFFLCQLQGVHYCRLGSVFLAAEAGVQLYLAAPLGPVLEAGDIRLHS